MKISKDSITFCKKSTIKELQATKGIFYLVLKKNKPFFMPILIEPYLT